MVKNGFLKFLRVLCEDGENDDREEEDWALW